MVGFGVEGWRDDVGGLEGCGLVLEGWLHELVGTGECKRGCVSRVKLLGVYARFESVIICIITESGTYV